MLVQAGVRVLGSRAERGSFPDSLKVQEGRDVIRVLRGCLELPTLSFLDILAIRSTECLVLATGDSKQRPV